MSNPTNLTTQRKGEVSIQVSFHSLLYLKQKGSILEVLIKRISIYNMKLSITNNELNVETQTTLCLT